MNMMDSTPLMSLQIALYEEMAGLSAKMASAAQANDWDALIDLERRVAALRDTLMTTDETGLTEFDKARKHDLVQQILDDDAEVRRHTEPWMEQVRRYLGAGATQRRVENAYGAMR